MRFPHSPLLVLLVLSGVLTIGLSGCLLASRGARDLGPGHRHLPTHKPVISSPIGADLDGDGDMEIAVGSWDGRFYVLDTHLNLLPGWPRRSQRGFFSSPALVDLDQDGDSEIVVGSDRGRVYAWHHDGAPLEGFPVDMGYQVWSSPTVLDGPAVHDGPALAIGGNGQMHVLQADGDPQPGWPRPMEGWADATAAFDGEVLAITSLSPGDPSRGWVHAWGIDGQLLLGFPVDLSMDSDSSPALADFDADGRPWVVFGDDAGLLHVLDAQGAARHGFPVSTLGVVDGPTPTPHPPGGNVRSIEASPAVADLEGDGTLEIVVGSWDGRVYAWDDAGASLPGWPVEVDDQVISSAALVDLDGDGGLDVVVGSKDGRLHGWTTAGLPLPGFPYDLGAPVHSSPWVGDLDGDGGADVVVGANNGVHLLQNVGPLGRAPWPMFHRDAHHTGAVR